MTWDETILMIQEDKRFDTLAKDCFLEANFEENIRNFISSKEWEKTIIKISSLFNNTTIDKTVLDLGSGTGFTSIALSHLFKDVYATEPSNSHITGTGVLQKRINETNITNIHINNNIGEELPYEDGVFDFVYTRQCLHHAQNLNKMLEESYRVLKPGGIIFSTRDHVIKGQWELDVFLNSHPLHKFYNGENAFTLKQYLHAFSNAGFSMLEIIRFFDSEINYTPGTLESYQKYFDTYEQNLKKFLVKKLSILAKIPFILPIYLYSKNITLRTEDCISWRNYSFIAKKIG